MQTVTAPKLDRERRTQERPNPSTASTASRSWRRRLLGNPKCERLQMEKRVKLRPLPDVTEAQKATHLQQMECRQQKWKNRSMQCYQECTVAQTTEIHTLVCAVVIKAPKPLITFFFCVCFLDERVGEFYFVRVCERKVWQQKLPFLNIIA